MGIRLPAFYIYAGTAHYKGWHSSEAITPETVFVYTDEGLCGVTMAAFNKTQVMTNSHYTILSPTHPEFSPPQEGLRQLLHCIETHLTESRSSQPRYQQQLKTDRPKSRHSELLLLVQLTWSPWVSLAFLKLRISERNNEAKAMWSAAPEIWDTEEIPATPRRAVRTVPETH
jgi:hypothetical protein